jgi:purine-nucleoside phosphorylase
VNATDELSRIDLAADFLRRATKAKPQVVAILGSGLGDSLELKGAVEIPYDDIPGWPASRVRGHAGLLAVGRVGKTAVAILKGRVHYYEGWPLSHVVFPTRVLARMGARKLVVTNAAGGVNPAFEPGDLMVISDHLNLIGQNPLRGPNLDPLGPRFVDMTAAYDVAAARACAKKSKIAVREGVYAAVPGPSYETPAEVRMLRELGADAVGMSTVPEVLAARHAGLRVAGFSLITNRAAGLGKAALTHEEVMATAAKARPRLGRLIEEMLTWKSPTW